MKPLIKFLLWFFGILLCLILLITLIVSPVARMIVESNSESWIGRRVEVDRIGVNLFAGRVNIRDLKLYEADSDTLFFQASQILVDINLWQLLRGTYHVEQLHIADPAIRIMQQGDSLNFSDFIARFPADSTSKKTDTISREPVPYRIDDVMITGGIVHYVNHDFASDIKVQDLSLEVPEVAWDQPNLGLDYSFFLTSGGEVAGNFNLNQQTLEYIQKVKAESLNLSFILPYLTPYLNIKQMEGTGFIAMETGGNFKDPYHTSMQGNIDIRQFDVMGSKEQKEIGFEQLSIVFDSVNTYKGFVTIGNIRLDRLYVREDRYDSTNSFSSLIKRKFDGYTPDGQAPDSAFIISSESNPVVLLADYIHKMQEVVVIDSFAVNQVDITNGKMDFTDYTLLKPATIHIDQLNLSVHDINSANCKAFGRFHTNVDQTGQIDVQFSFCPFKPYDFEATYQLKNVKVVHYNEYSIFYTDYPFKEGTLFYHGSISSKNNKMKMNNNIFIKKIYLGEKVDNDAGLHLPMKLILAIVRDKEGNVFLELPIEGDLKDPKINYWGLIKQALGNFFRKIFSSPSRRLAKEYGEDEQFFKDLCFDAGQTELNPRQKRQLDKLVQVLSDKSQLVIDFQYLDDENKAAPDSVKEQVEHQNKLIKNYIDPFLNDPVSRIRFSSKHESERKGRKEGLCYRLVYSVIK